MRRARQGLRRVVPLIAGLAVMGCGNALEVENPTVIEEDDLRLPEAAELWANSSLHAVQKGWDATLVLLSVASDEVQASGPHGWWAIFDRGTFSDPGNAGLEGRYPDFASAVWMADEAIAVLDSLQEAGDLLDPSLLSRAYLYGALISAAAADVMEDYAPSDLTVSGPPVGAENMIGFYDKAVSYATSGLSLSPGTVLERDLLALRARAHHGKAVWQRLNPVPADVSGGGLVSSADAAIDASASLALDPTDWRMEFTYQFPVITSAAVGQFNCVVNWGPGDRYAVAPSGGTQRDSVVLLDPIDGIADPTLAREIPEIWYVEGHCASSTIGVTSAREMRLIVAEHELTQADTAAFATHVNATRGFESLSDWTAASGIAAREMLIHERQTRLFMTGRRLLDLYRFDIDSDSWLPDSEAATMPGTVYPIAQSEVDANCYLNGSCGG